MKLTFFDAELKIIIHFALITYESLCLSYWSPMTDFSALEMFNIVSKHLRNRGSIDLALAALLEAQRACQAESVPSKEKIQALSLSLEELCSVINNYTLCSLILFDQAAAYDKNIIKRHEQAFSSNIVALSYLSGVAEMFAKPGLVPEERATRIKILISSLLARCVYEHFEPEQALCNDLFGENLEKIKNLERHDDEGALFKKSLPYSASAPLSPHRNMRH